MPDINVNVTPEAIYVRSLKWDLDGNLFVCKGIPESIKDKLKEIFSAWGIGYDADRRDCKGSTINVKVNKRQFERVQFSIEKPIVTETK